ncbi:MAG: hypothetical protein NPMRTH4_980001 [Nitrosopumilales archaeon]|nr:MAG: hypothetical protein NPMRTH4_980001 [Nitrosopumilales archaeon]
MIKILELVGFVLVGIMFLSFVGFIPNQDSGLTPLFWGCAIGVLAIIIYRKKKEKSTE